MISRAKAVEGQFAQRTTVPRTRSRFLEVGLRLIREKPLGLLPEQVTRRRVCCSVSGPRVSNTGWGRTNWAGIY